MQTIKKLKRYADKAKFHQIIDKKTMKMKEVTKRKFERTLDRLDAKDSIDEKLHGVIYSKRAGVVQIAV